MTVCVRGEELEQKSPRKPGCVIAAIRLPLGLSPAAVAAAAAAEGPVGGVTGEALEEDRRLRDPGRREQGGRWVPPLVPRNEVGPSRNQGRACGSWGAQ